MSEIKDRREEEKRSADKIEDQDDKLKRIIAGNPMIYMHLNGF